MNFVKQILDNGFVERCQKNLLSICPHKKQYIPEWWVNYPWNVNWFGISLYHPDALFKKDGFDGSVSISLQGMLTPYPVQKEDIFLLNKGACRYICFTIGAIKLYETFSGKLPSQDVVNAFILASNTTIFLDIVNIL